MIYIVGGSGFVGSAFTRLLTAEQIPYRVIDRLNYHEYRGTECDVLINANGNSRKYLAENDPLADFDQSVRSVAETLSAFRPGSYIFLSSGDVYADQSRPEFTREDQVPAVARQTRYGLHKYLAEQLVMGAHNDWLVVRMGGFVGPHLKKNAIYDMLTGRALWLSGDSELQFISTDSAARIVWHLIQKGVRREVVNLGARGLVRLSDLHALIGSSSKFRNEARHVRYELNLEKLTSLLDWPIPETRIEVAEFMREWRFAHPSELHA